MIGSLGDSWDGKLGPILPTFAFPRQASCPPPTRSRIAASGYLTGGSGVPPVGSSSRIVGRTSQSAPASAVIALPGSHV